MYEVFYFALGIGPTTSYLEGCLVFLSAQALTTFWGHRLYNILRMSLPDDGGMPEGYDPFAPQAPQADPPAGYARCTCLPSRLSSLLIYVQQIFAMAHGILDLFSNVTI